MTKPRATERTRFPLGATADPNVASVMTFACYPSQKRTLDQLVNIARARGGRMTRSQAIRWAVEHAPWEDLPDL